MSPPVGSAMNCEIMKGKTSAISPIDEVDTGDVYGYHRDAVFLCKEGYLVCRQCRRAPVNCECFTIG